jgi:hypothetical protein
MNRDDKERFSLKNPQIPCESQPPYSPRQIVLSAHHYAKAPSPKACGTGAEPGFYLYERWSVEIQARQPQLQGFPDKVNGSLLKDWPMSKELGKLLDPNELGLVLEPEERKEKEKTCSLIRGVVASVNELICNNFRLTPSGDSTMRDSPLSRQFFR